MDDDSGIVTGVFRAGELAMLALFDEERGIVAFEPELFMASAGNFKAVFGK